MRTNRKNTPIIGLALVAVFCLSVFGFQPALAEEKATEDWKFHTIVDVDFVKQYAKVPQPEGVMVIDSRPYKPKYVDGHIPTAVSIPDSQFDKNVAMLPEDKTTMLIFYCQGPT